MLSKRWVLFLLLRGHIRVLTSPVKRRQCLLYFSVPLVHFPRQSFIDREEVVFLAPQIVSFCPSESQFILELSNSPLCLLTRSTFSLSSILTLRQLARELRCLRLQLDNLGSELDDRRRHSRTLSQLFV